MSELSEDPLNISGYEARLVQCQAGVEYYRKLLKLDPYGWIKCSERLPELHVRVLIFANKIYYSWRFQFDGKDYWNADYAPYDCQPTHWQPLPEPPTQEKPMIDHLEIPKATDACNVGLMSQEILKAESKINEIIDEINAMKQGVERLEHIQKLLVVEKNTICDAVRAMWIANPPDGAKLPSYFQDTSKARPCQKIVQEPTDE